jgi:CRP/FNR family cyclic AMP-dependent transcriptional regulator
MIGLDGLGFVAARLVLATSCMRQLVPLRTLAILSNLAFMIYGYWGRLEPVLLLHLTLLPVNAYRLRQVLATECRRAVGRRNARGAIGAHHG